MTYFWNSWSLLKSEFIDCSCVAPGYNGSVVQASYGRCLAYYQPSSFIDWIGYHPFCNSSSLINGTGIGCEAKLLGSDFSNIQTAWNGIMPDCWISLDPPGISGYPNCMFWFNWYCPGGGDQTGYPAVSADLPNGLYDNTSSSLKGMLPSNFGPIEFFSETTLLPAVMCEFGN